LVGVLVIMILLLMLNIHTEAVSKHLSLVDVLFKIGPVIPFSNGLEINSDQKVHGNNGLVISTALDNTMVHKMKVISTWNVPIVVYVIVNLVNVNVSMDIPVSDVIV
jgi:hypothetical protein